MSVKNKRPLSVWITQGFLFFFGFLFLASLISSLIGVKQSWSNPSREMGATGWLGLAGIIFMHIAIVAFITITFLSLVKRKSHGRWLGVACLSLFFLLSLGGQLINPDGAFAYKQYENSTQLATGIMTTVILYSLFLTLIITLARSEKVTSFFKDEDAIEPPPTEFENPPITN